MRHVRGFPQGKHIYIYIYIFVFSVYLRAALNESHN